MAWDEMLANRVMASMTWKQSLQTMFYGIGCLIAGVAITWSIMRDAPPPGPVGCPAPPCTCHCAAPVCPPTSITAEGAGGTVLMCGGACAGDETNGWKCMSAEVAP